MLKPLERLRSLWFAWRMRALRRQCARNSIRSVVVPSGQCWAEIPVSSDLLSLVVRGRFEADHLRVVSSLLGEGDSCIDVGANVGLMSLEFARLVGSSGCVLAYEPEPSTFRSLIANLTRNGSGQVRAFNMALSDRPRSATLEFPAGRSEYASLAEVVHPSAGDGPRSFTTVELESLDRKALPLLTGCRLIKFDTEGHELHVLRGASQLIARWRPFLSIEIVPSLLASHGSSPDDLLDLLSSWGYSVRDMGGTGIDRSRLGSRGYHQFIAEPG